MGKTGICAKPAPEYSCSSGLLSACMPVRAASMKSCLKLPSKSLPNVHVMESRDLESCFEASPNHFAFKGGLWHGKGDHPEQKEQSNALQ